jgi:hypothetical protein
VKLQHAKTQQSCRRRRSRLRVLAFVAAVYVAGTAIARRRGYNIGTHTVVRCRDGHLFTTIWIPGVSVKSLRLGWYRFQRCPVGGHWTIVSPVKEIDLTEEERESAAENHDVRIP